MAELETWLADVETQWANIPEYKVDPGRLKHLAIICDGSRRASLEKGLDPYFGHRVGVEVIKGTARAARQWGIKTLSFWVWSTENWDREEDQIEFVMELAQRHLSQEDFLNDLLDNGIRFRQIGRKDRLPLSLARTLQHLENSTRQLSNYYLNLCLDYGGLDEMARGI